MARIPEDRFRLGLVMDFTISENLVLERLQEPQFCRGIFCAGGRIAEFGPAVDGSFDIRASSARVPTRSLSGGNIQKVLLARELSLDPLVILAAQPTRGLDIGAAAYVHRLLEEEKDKGKGVILISEDLDELLAVCDTIAVMYEGEVMKKRLGAEATKERLGRLMMGVRDESPAPGIELIKLVKRPPDLVATAPARLGGAGFFPDQRGLYSPGRRGMFWSAIG